MEELIKKLTQLNELIKAIKAEKPKTPFALPSIPPLKQPPKPSMTPPKVNAKMGQGVSPNSKKDPKKVAQQIKDGSMSTKTQKVMLKADSQTGQWYLEPTDPSSV